jgi:ATP-binding cassette subfamily B (MDR/TAP) protein 1
VLLEGNDPAAIDAAKDTVLHDSALNASYLVYIGIGMLVCTLTQEISFFDDLGSGEVATRIESDTHLVHTGLGEKVPTSVQYISTFLTGFILAFG